MARKVLVSLISKQTVPNLEMIKEFKNEIDKYIFITTKKMEEQLEWILTTAGISNEVTDTIPVNPFDILDIENKLSEYKFPDAEYIINITGGTKLMTIIIQDYFKSLGAKIFYVTGYNKNYLKIFPSIGQREFKLKSKINLQEYLSVNGFSLKKGKAYHSFEMSERMLDFYLKNKQKSYFDLLGILQQKRNTKKPIEIKSLSGLCNFIKETGYTPIASDEKINKYDIRYLTGDWFEEYIYFRTKKEYGLSDVEIDTGCKLNINGIPNEIDVIFIHNNKLYIIECKTSIYQKVQNQVDGELVTKYRNILGEVIYKSDALNQKFGLFSNTAIITLDKIRDELGNILKKFETHHKRAELSNIKLVSKQDIVKNTPIKEIFN